MCGITGMVVADGARAIDPNRLRAMCRTLVHRGPDEEGFYVNGSVGLAVRRLAVIDVVHGRQPVRSEDGTIHAVLNGEIYNHGELRRQLAQRGHTFASRSDAEVIPHLYKEYGVDFARRLEGMFAIALFDNPRRRLVLCRDRVGVKPLYYAERDGGLVFGSEMKAVLCSIVDRTPDLQAFSAYLSLMYVPGPRTMYREVRRLAPGAMLVWQDNAYTIGRFWALEDVTQRLDLTPRRARDLLRDVVVDSVRQQLAADVPLGFFLSGGMDSSTVVAAARRVRPDAALKTFSVGFADPSMVPTYYLCELARRHVTVALSGDGGDELFAGYLTYQADKIARYYRRLPRALTARVAPALLRFLPRSNARA